MTGWLERPDRLPWLTVVLPVRNEADFIERSLSSVLEQDYPSDRLEVLLVDGRSSDRTRELAEELARDRDVVFRIVDNPARHAAAALNLGVAEAKGEIVLRVDGHCEIGPRHAKTAVAALRDPTVGCVGGPIATLADGTVGPAIAAAMSSFFGVGDSSFRVGSERAVDVDTVPFPAFRAEVLKRVGPFDEELVRNQDDDYSYRLRAAGLRVVLLPELESRYYSRTTLRRLLRQFFEYGVWKVRVLQKNPRQMKARQFVPAVFALALTLSIVGVVATPRPLMALAGAYGLAAGFSAVVAAARSSWSLFPALPFAFAAMHLGYGFGFVIGLVRFRRRWRDRATPRPGPIASEGRTA